MTRLLVVLIGGYAFLGLGFLMFYSPQIVAHIQHSRRRSRVVNMILAIAFVVIAVCGVAIFFLVFWPTD